ncbi:MAG: hypothetical protein FWD03_05615 [Defluviitaleaceae bacterium]|nr:hypothetical protein [Defluviitaleaceae bacterium]
MTNTASYFMFSSLYFALVAAVFVILGVSISQFSLPLIALGTMFAVSFICAMFFYMKALEIGPMGLSFLFFSAGMLVPILFGIVAFSEPAPLHNIAGLGLLFVAFFISTRSSGTSNASGKLSRKWLVYILLSLFTNGVIGIAIRLFQTVAPPEAVNDFLFLAFGQAAIIALAVGALLLWKNKETISHFYTLPFVWVALGTALSTAGGNFMMMQLSLRVSALVQFPVVNGSLIITAIIISRIVFKEQVTKRHLQTIAVGLLAIILLSL